MRNKNASEMPIQVKCTEVVQISLLPEDVESAKSLLLDPHELVMAFLEVAKDGYSVTIMYDSVDDKWTARLAGYVAGKPNSGKLLYGNGATPLLAIASLYVKHFLKSNGGLWESSQTSSSMLS